MSRDTRPNSPCLTIPSDDRPTAIIYCEANFATSDGKTANGLVRHSERYRILSVIDSRHAGRDAGLVLDGASNGVAMCADLDDSITHATSTSGAPPDFFIFGVAPTSGMLSTSERLLVLQAISSGMNIVNGLHEFLNDDPEFAAAATIHAVELIDIRRPPPKHELRMFTGRIADVSCPRIAVLGTDGAVGKRTTATVLTRALTGAGIRAVMVSTGQTGLIQGARYGVALDAIPAQFCAGEMEAAVLAAFDGEDPEVIIIEGQGALSHPAYLTSAYILRGSQPDAVILQHAPARVADGQFGRVVMPTVASEIALIETFSDTKVIGVTLNHENMDDVQVSAAITRFERELGLPVTDALLRPTDRLVDMVLAEFPLLAGELLVAT
jgi:uncharacterized NAD-dependent epimerase/dehydratase family protein